MKSLLLSALLLGCSLPAGAATWRTDLRQWRGQLNQASRAKQVSQRKVVRLAKHRLQSIRPNDIAFAPKVQASAGNLHTKLALSSGHPGIEVCHDVRERFTRTNYNMKLLRQWVDYLDRLLDSRHTCQNKVDHALRQIDLLVELIADGYPNSFDEPNIVGVFHWAVILPGNTQSIGKFKSRRTHWKINMVDIESIELGELKWPMKESPIAVAVTNQDHSIEFSLPLSLTQVCVGTALPTIKGTIMATSTYKHNFPDVSLRALPSSASPPKEYPFEITLKGPQ